MDWFSWLSKSNLDPSLVYEYSLAFSHKELGKDDISVFDHEFLQSMGISVAKHRHEILNLASKQKLPRPMSKVLTGIRRRFSKYFRTIVRRGEHPEVAACVAARRSYGERWEENKKSTGERVLITNGSSILFPSSRMSSFSSQMVQEILRDDGDYYYDDCWPCGVEEIRWDTMFQNIKPT